MCFLEETKAIVESCGFMVYECKPFEGAIKSVRAAPKDNYFYFKRDQQNILVKTLQQKVSGSSADKVAMFYLNLQNTPYDKVYVVCDTSNVKAFAPLIKFFQKRHITLTAVDVVHFDDFKNVLCGT